MTLRGDDYVENIDLSEIANMARAAKGRDRYGYRSEFIDLVDILDEIEK
jgi:hypothetical protein